MNLVIAIAILLGAMAQPSSAQTYCFNSADGSLGSASFQLCPNGPGPSGPPGADGAPGATGPQGPPGVGGGRTILTSSPTYYLSPTGSDTTGDGTQTNPWKTRQFVYNKLQASYDLGGQTVLVQFLDGWAQDPFTASGPIIGQRGSGGLVFQGNCTTPRNTLIQPTSAGSGQFYAFGANSGAAYSMRCLKAGMNPGPAGYRDDTISVGYQSDVQIKDNFIFGDNLNDKNDMTVNQRGRIVVNNSYSKDSTVSTKTGSWSSGGSTITVQGSSSDLTPYQGVSCNGCAPGTRVTGVNGLSIGITPALTASGSNASVSFFHGAQTHLDAGDGATVTYQTNGVPGTISVTFNQCTYFYVSSIYADLLGTINFPAVGWTGCSSGKKFDVRGNSVVLAGSGGSTLPGNITGTVTSGAQMQ